jgi:hypothetical protein
VAARGAGASAGDEFLMSPGLNYGANLARAFRRGLTGDTLFSATPWTSGMLDAYLGISASPANPIGAYLPSTQALDPGATGFFVFQANLGTLTLQSPSNPNVSPLENISAGLPLASYIVGFFNEAGTIQATANSGAIFERVPVPGPVVGAGLPGLIAACGGLLALARRRRRQLVA